MEKKMEEITEIKKIKKIEAYFELYIYNVLLLKNQCVLFQILICSLGFIWSKSFVCQKNNKHQIIILQKKSVLIFLAIL